MTFPDTATLIAMAERHNADETGCVKFTPRGWKTFAAAILAAAKAEPAED